MMLRSVFLKNKSIKKTERLVVCYLLSVVFFQNSLSAQNSQELFASMSFQNKVWAIKNVKSIKKAFDISKNVLHTMDSLYKAKNFETNVEGSRYDAFRHVFWMYSLASEIGEEKSRRIGVMYEDYNEYVFSLKSLSGYDAAGRMMDEYNNEVGLYLFSKIGKQNKEIVIKNIKEMMAKGYMKIIAKKNQNSLDKEGNVIKEEEWKSNWKNNRYLINSNVNL